MLTLSKEQYLEGVKLSSFLRLGLNNITDVLDLIIDLKIHHKPYNELIINYQLDYKKYKAIIKELHNQYERYGPPISYMTCKIQPTIAVNEEGCVIRIRTRNIIPYTISNNGYCYITWYGNKKINYYVHKLVASTYLQKGISLRRMQYVINHKDGNKLNNNVNNLEYVTQSYNTKHAIKNNIRVYKSKLSKEQVDDMRKEYNNGDISIRTISRKYKIDHKTVRDILDNKIHKDMSYTRSRYPTNEGIAKFTQDEVKDIRKLYSSSAISIYAIAKDKNVDATTIKKIVNNDSYRDDSYIPITREEKKKKLSLKKK